MISSNKQQAMTQRNPFSNYVPPDNLKPWVTPVTVLVSPSPPHRCFGSNRPNMISSSRHAFDWEMCISTPSCPEE